jgi:cyclophilin family peptidyl-prolyl cis-trans isomerase
MNATWLLALGLLLTHPDGAPEEPRLADERIVFHTTAGDLVLALYPDVAPGHVQQLLRLVKLGIYDTMPFHRIEKNFVVQLASHHWRRLPLSESQKQAVHPLRAEFSAIPHRRGTLSMAREDNRPDSGETSFSILLGDAPHLDGQYTVFGHIEYGMDVIDKFLQVPVDARHQPLALLEVTRAEVVPAHLLSGAKLSAAKEVAVPKEYLDAQARASSAAEQAAYREEILGGIGLVVGGVGLMTAVGLVNFFGSGRLSAQYILSLNLINVLIGGFVLFVVLTPIAHRSQVFAAGVFFGLLSLLKLMSRFESPT